MGGFGSITSVILKDRNLMNVLREKYKKKK